MNQTNEGARRVAVIGAGIGGLSAAWLMGDRVRTTVFEAERRLGGHANTVVAASGGQLTAVDTGFIVYNEPNYPNFTALLETLGVASQAADMALSVSLDDGAFEYSSFGAAGLFAQKRNLVSARFWSMLRDVLRFYREGPQDLSRLDAPLVSLEAYLREKGYCQAFRDDHLLPQAAAIWSTPLSAIGSYPAAALIRFFQNHGMMQVFGRGAWRTVKGGSIAYVDKLAAATPAEFRHGTSVARVRRDGGGVDLHLSNGECERFDEVVIATHADTALSLLVDPSPEETRLLSAFRYSRNLAVLHTDRSLMPRRRAAWTSWNHIGSRSAPEAGCVTYWMNRLQSLHEAPDLFVTLNPTKPIAPEAVLRTDVYDHPIFDAPALEAQAQLWSLQGRRRSWFCGSYFGHGFHEDALQSGLAVAEQMAGVRRPWRVENESGRIGLTQPPAVVAAA